MVWKTSCSFSRGARIIRWTSREYLSGGYPPYHPCMVYLPTFTIKIYQGCILRFHANLSGCIWGAFHLAVFFIVFPLSFQQKPLPPVQRPGRTWQKPWVSVNGGNGRFTRLFAEKFLLILGIKVQTNWFLFMGKSRVKKNSDLHKRHECRDVLFDIWPTWIFQEVSKWLATYLQRGYIGVITYNPLTNLLLPSSDIQVVCLHL